MADDGRVSALPVHRFRVISSSVDFRQFAIRGNSLVHLCMLKIAAIREIQNIHNLLIETIHILLLHRSRPESCGTVEGHAFFTHSSEESSESRESTGAAGDPSVTDGESSDASPRFQ